MTWIHDRLEISPFLNVTSATKRCGKSLLLEALGELVTSPAPVSGRVTSSALFRTIEMHAPTLLLDEADTFFGDDDELRGVVNGSQRRNSAYVMRCVSDDHEPRRFVTWCPKAIAGIGGLPDTVLDRSIVAKAHPAPSRCLPGALARPRPDRDRGVAPAGSRDGAVTRQRTSSRGCPRCRSRRGCMTAGAMPGKRCSQSGTWPAPIGRAVGGHGRRASTSRRALADGGNRRAGNAARRSAHHLRGEALAGSDRDQSGARRSDRDGRPSVERMEARKELSARGLSSLLKPFEVQSRNHRIPERESGEGVLRRGP